MNNKSGFDILIVGGGPAGACAALRLLDLGYRVVLAEQQVFPRAQIGESLSPGIQNIFNYLKAGHLLTDERYFHGLPAAVAWEGKAAQAISPQQRGPGIMVNRAQLDMELINLAVSRGLHLLQPAKLVSCKKEDESWYARIIENGQARSIKATFILDARGRKGVRSENKIITGASSIALWTHVSTAGFPKETLIEAVDNGWLWGAPVSANQFRVMGVVEAAAINHKRPNELLTGLVNNSQLFKPAAAYISGNHVQTCKVDSYCHDTPWTDNYIRLGETAFTLDPLSSTGMEKAMRLSLQAAIAVNTILHGGDPHMAGTFYEDRLIESVIAHARWTAGYYQQAWPEKTNPFWKSRSEKSILATKNSSPFQERLLHGATAVAENQKPGQLPNIDLRQTLENLWYQPARISPGLIFTKTPCIVNDQLELKTAIGHASLERAIAYLDEVEIEPLLQHLATGDTFGDLVHKWGRTLPLQQAARISVRLNQLGILIA